MNPFSYALYVIEEIISGVAVLLLCIIVSFFDWVMECYAAVEKWVDNDGWYL